MIGIRKKQATWEWICLRFPLWVKDFLEKQEFPKQYPIEIEVIQDHEEHAVTYTFKVGQRRAKLYARDNRCPI